MSFSWWTFALQAANFLILVWLLQRFLFKPVKAIVAKRKEEISRALNETAAEKQAIDQLKQEIEAKRSEIENERQKMLDESRAQLAAERDRTIAEARHEAENIRAQALKKLEDERVAASDELFSRTVALATNLAERMLTEIAAPSVEQQFLERVIGYLDGLSPDERIKLLPRSGSCALIVTTAHPLDAQEQSQWREQMEQRLGDGIAVNFSTDPALIAGAVVTFPHAILRFNWRDSLSSALKQIRTDGQPR